MMLIFTVQRSSLKANFFQYAIFILSILKFWGNFISLIKDDNITENIRELLSYDDDSAGGLMAKELISVYENWSVSTCLKEIRKQAENITRVHSIYVLNRKNELIGRLSLKDLITSPSKSKIKEIITILFDKK